jgi:enoyl-CoA hydratase/carnithine racemase
MRRGFDGLASIVQATLAEDPFSSHVFGFVAAREIVSRCSGGAEMVCACWPAYGLPAEHLMDEAISYANDIAMNVSPRSVRVMKQQLSTAPFQSLSEAIALANHEMFESLQSADFKEGVGHFIERRPAKFTGQ